MHCRQVICKGKTSVVMANRTMREGKQQHLRASSDVQHWTTPNHLNLSLTISQGYLDSMIKVHLTNVPCKTDMPRARSSWPSLSIN